MTDVIKETSPRRSPSAGGYARGEETRARIIDAALKVFGEEGYVSASTRQIAKEAGVMPPALQYYFDSKEGLHRACAEFIVENAAPTLFPAIDAAAAVLAEGRPKTAADALCDLMDALVDASLFAANAQHWLTFSARIKGEEDSPGGQVIEARVAAPIRDLFARLVAQATGSPLDDTARLRGLAILSQVSAFSIHLEGSLQAMTWPDFNGPRRDAVKAVLRAHTRAALGAWPPKP